MGNRKSESVEPQLLTVTRALHACTS